MYINYKIEEWGRKITVKFCEGYAENHFIINILSDCTNFNVCHVEFLLMLMSRFIMDRKFILVVQALSGDILFRCGYRKLIYDFGSREVVN